jgi:hypothetical protein
MWKKGAFPHGEAMTNDVEVSLMRLEPKDVAPELTDNMREIFPDLSE